MDMFMVGWTRARAMPSPPFQVPHLSQTEILLRVESDNLSEAPVCVGNSFQGKSGVEAES